MVGREVRTSLGSLMSSLAEGSSLKVVGSSFTMKGMARSPETLETMAAIIMEEGTTTAGSTMEADLMEETSVETSDLYVVDSKLCLGVNTNICFTKEFLGVLKCIKVERVTNRRMDGGTKRFYHLLKVQNFFSRILDFGQILMIHCMKKNICLIYFLSRS